MKKITLALLLGIIMISVNAQNRAAWMKDAKWGVMLHYSIERLVSNNLLESEVNTLDGWNELIDNFDCDALAKQLSDVGAGYLIITVRHLGGFFLSPNSMYDHYMGESPRVSSNRDLVVDLYEALHKHGIKLIVYCMTNFNWNPAELIAFAYDRDDPRRAETFLRWQEVIREYSIRWGDKVSGWWFDGCYLPNTYFRHPDIPNFASMAAAARAGNPESIVAFNRGVFPRVKSITPYEDYTAGEINNPETISFRNHGGGFIDGSQIQILSYLGTTWGIGAPRFTQEDVVRFSLRINEVGGAVTWDVPPMPDGTIADDFMEQLVEIGKALGTIEK